MSQEMINVETHGRVGLITINRPKAMNALNDQVMDEIGAALDAFEADENIGAIVITGSEKAFAAGADIGAMASFSYMDAYKGDYISRNWERVKTCRKPVIAAVAGFALGGGCELAMMCDFIIAADSAKFGQPEVKLGILPGAGGTQRLPRVVPLEMATNMIVSGTPIKSEKFKGTKLFDEIVEGDVVQAAVAFARKAVSDKLGLPKVRDLKIEHEDAEAFLQFSLNTVRTVAKNFPAPAACVQAIQAAVKLPFEQGLKRERELFLHLVQTPESRALRHAFFGERAASKVPDVPADTPLRKIESAAVIGAGTMGGGIAMNFANAGIPVRLLEMKQEALDRGLATIRKNYENSAKKGRMTMDDVEKRMSLITPTLSYDDIGQADIVIEAVFEDMAVKEQVFRKLDEVMKPGAILATNTSTLDVNKIASFTKRPQDVIGTHFFSPANVMKLLEIVRGEKTAKDVLATTLALAKRIRKTGVVSGVCDGFIGNRMIEQYSRQAGYMVEEGASPQQVDKAIEKFGFAMGPFRMSDLAGNDVGWYIRKRRYVERPDMKYPKIADKICELGRFGQKTGAGFYRYEAGKRDAIPDPVVDKLIEDHRKELGITPRKLSDDEIVHRLVFALVNEGAKILEEGIASKASDIDMIYLTGYGFPLHRGGPMLYADTYGLYNVVNRMKDFAANPHGDPSFWEPAPLLAKLAAEGKGFNG